MFISEFESKESLCNVMPEIYKKRDAKKKKQILKDCLNYLRLRVINSIFSYNLFVGWFVSRDSEVYLVPNETSITECFCENS